MLCSLYCTKTQRVYWSVWMRGKKHVLGNGEQYPACCRVFKTLQRPDIRISIRALHIHPRPSAYHPHTIGHQRRATHDLPFPFSVCEVFDVRRRFVSTDFVSRSSRGVLIMQRPVLMARSIWGAAFSISSCSPMVCSSLAVVSRSSEESLLPRLATWKRAENLVCRIGLAIECHMQRAPFTLGLGEPNLCGKPILDYDRGCQPSYVCSLKRTPAQGNGEDNTLRTAHQILECWLFSAGMLVNRIEEKVNSGDLKGAAKDSWVVERTWKLLAETANLLLLMDPDDFLRLKQLLAMDSSTGAYCLRSRALRDLTRACKNLSHLVPRVVRVDADPKGGPRLQQAVMNLFHSHGSSSAKMETGSSEFPCVPSTAIHLLQAFQAIEAAVRRFFFSYQQLVITVMGSVEMKRSSYKPDGLTQIYLEPPYFPSLDGAKAFLGDYCRHNHTLNSNAISLNLSMCSVPSDDSMTLVDSFNSEPDQRYQPHDKFRRG